MSHTVRYPAKNLPMKRLEKIEDMVKAIRFLGQEPELAVDTETTGLQWYAADFRPFYITFCDGTMGYGMPFPVKNGPVWRAMKEKIFENAMQKHIYHNAKFDLHAIRTQGIEDLGDVHDTQIISSLIDERDQHSLEALAEKYLEEGVRKYSDSVDNWFEEQKIKQDDRRYDKLPAEILEPYAIQDTIVTWWYWKGSYATLQANPHWKKCYEEVEKPCLLALTDVESTGYRINLKLLKDAEPELMGKALQLEKTARKEILEKLPKSGPAPQPFQTPAARQDYADTINFSSHDQVVDLFLNKLKVDRSLLGTTKGGKKSGPKPSVDQWTYERIGTVEALAIRDYLSLMKLINTFIKNIEKYSIKEEDGWDVHGNFFQMGARTGRMSASDPNLQNLPAVDEEEKENPYNMIRQSFICRPGMVNMFFDWSQIEMAVLGHYAEDPILTESLNNGEDLHRAMAAVLFDKKPEDVTKKERSDAKTINFACIYGAGQKKIAAGIGKDLASARKLLDDYNKKFRGIADFRERVQRVVRTRGYVKTLFGRYRHLEPDKAYVGVNSIIQGTATGDMIKIAVARVYGFLKKREPRAHIISVVHDELHIETPIGTEKFLIPEIKALLEKWPELRIPIRADASWTLTNWFDKVPYETNSTN